MSDTSKSAESLSDLAADLEYFKSLVKDEKSKILFRVNSAIEVAENPYSHLSIVADNLSQSIAVLSARVKVLESVLGGSQQVTIFDNPIASIPSYSMKLPDEIEVPAEQFANDENMHGLEIAENGTSFVWTGPSTQTRFEIPINRSENKLFRLGLLSVINDELLERLEVKVDGKNVPHSIDFHDGMNSICLNLPQSPKEETTVVEVQLGRTYSAMELGKGQDQRKLGIAIAGYKVERLEA